MTKLQLRVLVVDDHRDGANALALLLREHGHNARIAYGAGEAVELAAAFRPHAVILDLMMPGADGFEALARLQRQGWASDAVFIAYTGVSTPNIASVAGGAGFDHLLRKPVRYEVLQSALSSARVSYVELLLDRAAEYVAQSEGFLTSNRLEKFLDDVQRVKERSQQRVTMARASLHALDSAMGAVTSRYVHGALPHEAKCRDVGDVAHARVDKQR